MKRKFIYKIFLILFAVLYVSTAFISFLHAIEFFSIGNAEWMSYVLSAVFEVGQMTVLMSLLLSDNNKKMLPWVLMTIFTSVQVVSNVYSVTKFIMLSEVEYYKYLEQALRFIVQNIPQEMIITVIAWIIGGLLPVCALLLTAMCASQMRIMEDNEKVEMPDVSEEADTGDIKVPEQNPTIEEPKKENVHITEPVLKAPAPKPAPTPKRDDDVKKAGSRIIPSKEVEQHKTANNTTEKSSAKMASDTYFEKPDVERK